MFYFLTSTVLIISFYIIGFSIFFFFKTKIIKITDILEDLKIVYE